MCVVVFMNMTAHRASLQSTRVVRIQNMLSLFLEKLSAKFLFILAKLVWYGHISEGTTV